MLVLYKKKRKKIQIGPDIVITVQRLNGNRVSIGIDAPPDCKIKRGELDDNNPPGGTAPQQIVSLPRKQTKQSPGVRRGQRNAS